MSNINEKMNEAVSNISIENKKLKNKDLKIIRDALETKQKSFIKTLYEGIIRNEKNRRK